MPTSPRSLPIALAGAVLSAVALFAFPSIFPTGVTRYDPARAYNCYVLFGGTEGKTHLIDMNGVSVHEWPYVGFPSEMLDPEIAGGTRGHLLVQLSSTGPRPSLFTNKTIGEVDWDGKVLWEWGATAPGGAARQNHDWYRLPNGNTLLIAGVLHAVKGFKSNLIQDQAIYEVTPQGDLVWQWLASDHLEEMGFSPEGLRLIREDSSGRNGAVSGFLTLNDMHVLGPNRWFRGGDSRFDPDNIMIDARNGNFTAIIEKTTGKFVWRLGPYYVPTGQQGFRVPRPVDRISGQHDAHLIPDGMPGAGNLLLFDNQGDAGFPPAELRTTRGSRVLEIDPVKKEIVWEYGGQSSDAPNWTFFSSFISSARRLPNGNTLIDEGMNGRFFQVTPKGDIVWEYVSPYFARSSVAGSRIVDGVRQELPSNWVYRAQPIPYDWVPVGTPRSEKAVVPPDLSTFRVPNPSAPK